MIDGGVQLTVLLPCNLDPYKFAGRLITLGHFFGRAVQHYSSALPKSWSGEGRGEGRLGSGIEDCGLRVVGRSESRTTVSMESICIWLVMYGARLRSVLRVWDGVLP